MQILGVLYSLIIIISLTYWLTKVDWIRTSGISTKLIWSIASIRFVGTLFQQALYTYFYTDRTTADIYRFFDDGVFLQQAARTNPVDYVKILFGFRIENEYFLVNYFDKMNTWLKPFESGFYNDNHIMIRSNSILAWFSGGYYEVHGQIFSFLAFIGMLLLIKAILSDHKFRNRALLILTILPSTTLWLTGSLKESVLIFGLGLFLYNALQIVTGRKKKINSWIGLFMGTFILMQIKIYFLIALLPVFVTFLLRLKLRFSVRTYWLILLILCLSGAVMLHFSGIDIAQNVSQKQHDFINHMNETKAGSAFEITPIEPTILDLIIHTPQAIATALFRPIVPMSFAEILMTVENLIFIFIVMIWFVNQFHNGLKISEHWKWILPLSIILLALIGLTTPVFGAIMRYRAPILLLLVLVFIPQNFQIFQTKLK